MKQDSSKVSARRAIWFEATLLRPKATDSAKASAWTFLKLPAKASKALPSRGLVSIKGVFNGVNFRAMLAPDGQGGHWLKVDQKLRKAAGADVGDVVTLEVVPVEAGEEPEPDVPADIRKALDAAPANAREAWSDITPVARRDWIHWITSCKRAETRVNRIEMACDMLANGKRRPCCFDRSGMYSQSLQCPVAEDVSGDGVLKK